MFLVPGHATSWRHSHPELFSSGAAATCGRQVDGAPAGVLRGALDPAKNSTFVFIEALLTDYCDKESGAFADEFVHLGADEVPTACWANPTDTAFIQKHGLNGTTGLFSYFVERVHAVAQGLGQRVIMWDAAFNKGSAPPPKDVVIQMWLQYGGANTLMQEIVRAGYSAIASPDVPWCKCTSNPHHNSSSRHIFRLLVFTDLNVVEPRDAACNTQWQCMYLLWRICIHNKATICSWFWV